MNEEEREYNEALTRLNDHSRDLAEHLNGWQVEGKPVAPYNFEDGESDPLAGTHTFERDGDEPGAFIERDDDWPDFIASVFWRHSLGRWDWEALSHK